MNYLYILLETYDPISFLKSQSHMEFQALLIIEFLRFLLRIPYPVIILSIDCNLNMLLRRSQPLKQTADFDVLTRGQEY